MVPVHVGMPLHRMAVAWGDPDLRADLSPTPFFPLLRVVPEELFMTEQKRAAVEYTQEELETMTKAVLNGATIGDVCNVSQDMLESLYSLGYNLYTSGNYNDAETVFSGL